MAVRMELSKILIRETADTHIVELREVEGERVFAILIGLAEARAIERRLMDVVPPRPQTHELLASVIDSVGYTVEAVILNDLKEGTYFARLQLRKGDELVEVDSRPSDALAIGVAGDVPIYVEEHVLDEATRPA
ncbi:bifunctional nuclease family protein [Mucisphaera sp.]|uniref:bifunctional nuclease family protein n=1 Tax=Mucisphaera sp. TaxID=2913024 RepID=UPI003D10A180